MDNTYDFKLQQLNLVEALALYRQLEQILEEEKERLEPEIMNMGSEWGGQAAEDTLAGLYAFLENGEYAKTLQKVTMMRTLLEENLPQINDLLARCEAFDAQFDSDDYVEPYKPVEGDNTIHNAGVLAINYTNGRHIPPLCDAISEEGHRVGANLKKILTDCADLLPDSAEDMEAVDRAVRKLDRVLNYKDSYVLYAKGVEALEFDLMTGLRTVEAYPLTVSEYMEQQKPAPVVTPESLKDVTENGYAYEVLLMREGDITATEARALAMVWAEISADTSEKGQDMQIRFLEALYGDGTDRDKSPRIESCLLESGNEEAYCTLRRMDNICLAEGSGEKYKIEAEVRDGQTVYEIYAVMNDETRELTVMNLTEEFAPYLEGEKECLVDPWKLEEWIGAIGSDEDYQLTQGLITEDYRDAFGAIYEEVNPVMLAYLLDYEEELFRDGTRASKEEFLNGMLYYNGSVCNYEGEWAELESNFNGNKYMYFLMSNSALKVEGYVSEGKEILPGSKEWEEFKRMTLYMSLYTIHDKYDGLESREGYLHIGNLSTDEETGMYTYDFNVIPKENIIALGEYRIKAVEATGSVNTATYEFGKIETPWEPGYLERSLNQMLYGCYSEDVTLLGTVGEILYGFTPFDFVQDIRDMTYYIGRMQDGAVSLENIFMTVVSFLSIFGIGELFSNWKYAKHLDNLNVDASDIKTIARVTEATEECLENSPKTISNILEQAEVAKYTDDVEAMGSVIVLTNKGDDVVTTAVKKTDTVEDAGDVITNANKVVDNSGFDTNKYNNWDDMKSTYKGTITQFVSENKPKYSPDIKKWFDNGGTIEIQNVGGNQIWTYTSSSGHSVPYIDGYIKFPDEYLNSTIKSVDIGEFTGDRGRDVDKMMLILEEDYGITEIPDGYVVHHDVENGILQLVDENIHAEFTHIGGHSLYK